MSNTMRIGDALGARAIAGKPWHPSAVYLKAWEELGDLDRMSLRLKISVKGCRQRLREMGINAKSLPGGRGQVASAAAPPSRFRCHCCGQIRQTPTCPVTGEVIALAFVP